ncbi:hypothetical protein FBU30_002107 [Linnemannia zychae]|nr:hypothetical protein FBU30_002107 [Linnemannia zychae]
MSTTNHLNHDGRTTNPSGPSSSSMPVNTASRRSVDSTTRSSISSTTRRGSSWKKRWDEIRPRKYRPQDYKLKGFGRVTQFSNERLYLHWIRFGVLQAGIAVTLLSFGIGIAAWVGMGLLVLALLTLIYATQLFHKRHLYLVSKRKDIKYFARVIPTLLTFGLFALYACNFALTMHYGEEVRSPLPWAKKDEYNFGDMF